MSKAKEETLKLQELLKKLDDAINSAVKHTIKVQDQVDRITCLKLVPELISIVKELSEIELADENSEEQSDYIQKIKELIIRAREIQNVSD